MKLKDRLMIAFWTMVIAAGIAFIVFYFKSILTADIPLWLKLYLLGESKMSKQSGYLQRRDAELNAAFNAGAAVAA